MTSFQKYVQDRTQPLMQLWWRGLSYAQIGVRMGMSRNQVAGLIWREIRRSKKRVLRGW